VQKKRFGRGFLLIEVLYAIFLVLTAALIVAATMPVATVSRTMSSQQDKAMDLAQKQMEAIRAAGFANCNAGQLASLGLIDSANPVGTNPSVFSFTNSDSQNLDNPSTVLTSGAGTVEIDQLSLNMVRVTITVTWTSQGTPYTFQIGSMEANL
jgi:type II secretory pathway pseudopilin PulG